MTTGIDFRKVVVLIFSAIVAILLLLLAVFHLHEFYIVRITKHYLGYSFGCVNENPWYYKTPLRYAYYNLAFGLLSLIAGLVFCNGLVRIQKTLMILSAVAMVFLLVFDFLGRMIIPC
ncbi:MAG TPA: hypothetical protein PKC72_07765 [Chitinophagaceae bacterium]|nr:hypothetical protein [Chitinophagaceae bacterium]